MLARIPMRHVQSLDDVIAYVESSDDERLIICDVDNTLPPQGLPPAEFGVLVNAAIDRLEAKRNVARAIALTNGPQRGVARVVGRGNKPWTTRRRLGLQRDDTPVVVVGDQVLTDGVLAWRLRATFLLLVIDDQTEERRQATMRRIGRILTEPFFRVHLAPGQHQRRVTDEKPDLQQALRLLHDDGGVIERLFGVGGASLTQSTRAPWNVDLVAA